MTALSLSEVIATDVVAKLQARLPNRVALINDEKGDGITIAAPEDGDYHTSYLASLPAKPIVLVLEGPTQFQEEGAHAFITRTHIAVYWFDQDPNLDTLMKKLQRGARALIEALWDDTPQEQLDPSRGFRIFPVSTDPGEPSRKHDTDPWRSSYIVVFEVWQLEGS